MEVLGWLLIPLVATVLGLAWAAWHSRERKPVAAEQAMQDRARFREAMEKPLPPGGRPSTPVDDGTDPRDRSR